MRIRKENDQLQDEEIVLLAQVSDALSHPLRIKIFQYIMQQNSAMEPVCNKEIVANFDYSQSTISQHLKKLIKSGLVIVKKKDTFSYYFANIGVYSKYTDAVRKIVKLK